MKRRKWMLAAAGVAVVVALGAGAVMAQTGEDADGTSFLDRVAAKLGVERPQLDQAIEEARDEKIDERVADGDLTEEQADRLKERLGEVPADGLFGGPLDGAPRVHGFGFEFRSGDGHGFHLKLKGARFGQFELHEKLAEFLGVDEETLVEELQADGATLGDVTEAHGKRREELRDFLLGELRTGIDEAVAEGWLPQDRADQIHERIAEHGDRFIDGEFGLPGFPRLFGDEDGEQQEAPQQRGEAERFFRS